ncbi:MAG: Organic solvent tolerance protein OstA [Bacteroidetes bacterium]|nr:Organic solvent tolerance protein OstA [Bacteroidota bacterium]
MRPPIDTVGTTQTGSVRDTSTVKVDTIKAVKSPSGLDSVVAYTATDSVVYSLRTKTMSMYGKGDIKYKDLGLKAENIDVNWNTSILNAVGVPDTADTTGKKFRGQPDLIDGGEKYHGSKIMYNFKSKKGKINLGETEVDKGLYYGEEIKRVDTDVLFVGEGKYTTCENEHPHYYFGSPEMKVAVKQNVVARPVYLYLSDVPVFALPFGIFPSQRGRRSGIIGPAYGENGRGRYLTHLGYYWAISDYMDLNLRGDGYSKGSWVLYSDFRYALRYKFTGGLSGSYAKTVSGLPGDPAFTKETQFNLHLGHNQDFNPTTRLVVDFTFSSGKYYQTTSNKLDDLLRQNIVSNATLTKSWEGTPNSMSINIRRDQNLQTGQVNEVLPSFSFNRSQSFPFRPKKRSEGEESQQWYELIGYSYGGLFLNVRNKVPNPPAIGGFTNDERRGVQHSVAVNASPKFSYFTITPFFNYSEKWYDKQIERSFNPIDSSITTKDIKAVKAVRYYDMGVSAATKLYGIFQPGIFGIKGIRHQISPSLTYTYQPDFSQPKYGYYGTYNDAAGLEQKYSLYEKEVFGGAPSGERQALGLNIGNVFEMKVAGGDSAGEDKKFTLLNLNAGISYNFVADSLRFSELGLSYRTDIGQFLNIGGGATFNLYKFEVGPNGRGTRVNKFLIKEQGRLAQLTNFSVSVGTRLSGEKKETKAGPIKSAEDSLAQGQKSGYVGLYDQEEPDFSIPWNLDLTWNFSQSQADPRQKIRSSNISASLGFNLTEFWKINASASYDVIAREFAAPQVTVYRDLHCWELDFSWVPTGLYRNYRFEIRLKAPQLRDVKVTKQFNSRDLF